MNQLRVIDLEQDLETSYLQYAVEVIINRAIPRLDKVNPNVKTEKEEFKVQ
ncbi:MAG: hypothetical protein U0401_26040 [Anaerolineae bacterium]